MYKRLNITITPEEDQAFRLWLSQQNTKRLRAGKNALNFSQALERAMRHIRTGKRADADALVRD